jgi:hypothetical protein
LTRWAAALLSAGATGIAAGEDALAREKSTTVDPFTIEVHA